MAPQYDSALAMSVPECAFLDGSISPSKVSREAMTRKSSPIEFAVPLVNADKGTLEIAAEAGLEKFRDVNRRAAAGRSRSILTFSSPSVPLAKGAVSLILTFSNAGLITSQCRISKAFTIADDFGAYLSLVSPRAFFHSSEGGATSYMSLAGSYLQPHHALDSIGIRIPDDNIRVPCTEQNFPSHSAASCSFPRSEVPAGQAVVEFSAGVTDVTVATFPITVLPEPRAQAVVPDTVSTHELTTVTVTFKDRIPTTHASLELALFDGQDKQLSTKVQWTDDKSAIFVGVEFTVPGTAYAAFYVDNAASVRVAGSDFTVAAGAQPEPTVKFVLPDTVYVAPADAGEQKTVTLEFRVGLTGYSQIGGRISKFKIGTVETDIISVHGRTLLVRATLPSVAAVYGALLLDKDGHMLARLDAAVTIQVSDTAGSTVERSAATVAFVNANKPISVKIAVANAPAGTVTVKTNDGKVVSVHEEKIGRTTILTVTLDKKCGACVGTVGRYVVSYTMPARPMPVVLSAAFEYVATHTVTSVWPTHFDFHRATVACIPYVVTFDALPADVPLALTIVGGSGIANENFIMDFPNSALTGCLTCKDCTAGKKLRAGITSPFATNAAETLGITVSVISTDGSEGQDDDDSDDDGGLHPGYIALIAILAIVVVLVVAALVWWGYKKRQAKLPQQSYAEETDNRDYTSI
jgi:hypothetical protein